MAGVELVLFDLDGTLLDTAPGLGLALNMQLQLHGLPPLSLEKIRPFASHGSKGLLGLGFGLTADDAAFIAMRDQYLALYDEVFLQSPQLFEGMVDLLEDIDNRKLRWGIVTNKPRRFTAPLMELLGFTSRAACVVCCDDAERAKPSPDTLLLACQQAGITPARSIYIGDAERDIQAGKAAGMPTVVALYGYIGSQDNPQAWGADAMISHPDEIKALL